MDGGVLALQGAFREHLRILVGLGATAAPVRLPEELEGLDGLIIPGGESTTIGKLATWYGLLPAVEGLAQAGKAVWGTCAGMILLAKALVGHDDQPRLCLLDVTVRRNGFGRQVDSFQSPLPVPALDKVALSEERGRPFPAVFIRAPLVERAGDAVQVLATLGDGTIVAVQQGQLLGTAFHPELTADSRFHRYFLGLARDGCRQG